MKATDLRGALNILDPERPLRTDEELKDWFVARPDSPIDELRILLEDTNEPQKVLFTGHRGSGKTSELAKLGQQLGDEFFIVHYSVKSILNLFDLSYVDVVLSLGLQLIREATQGDLAVEEDVLRQILAFGKDISEETELGATTRAEVGAELNFLVGKLSSKLGTEDATRRVVREKVSHRIGDLLESVDTLAREVERHTGRRVLVIVEDLDKTDLRTAKELFYEHASSLSAPPVSIIYTFPTALRHDNDFMQIVTNFPNPSILPGMKVVLRDGEPDEDGLECLRRVFTNRADESLIAPEALDRLAELSSGIPRELVALGRQACLEARKSENARIELDNVERAASRRRMEYQVLLTSRQLELLKAVHAARRVENDEEHRALLHNLSAVEYRNDEAWHDVHPVVVPLLDGS